MFDASIPYYDLLYSDKDYEREVAMLRELITPRLKTGGRRLLDVACGTGRHLELLARDFTTEGLDVSEAFLEVARARNPGVAFHLGTMAEFDLETTFDVVTCLFSSIGYLRTLDEVRGAAASFCRHLVPGGLALVEPWFRPDQWNVPSCHAVLVADRPDLKIARLNTSLRDGRLSVFDLHYLVSTLEGTEHFVERHEMGLFETAELVEAFEDAGFDVEVDEEGLIGRGMLIGARRA